jgi:hypothetical protein
MVMSLSSQELASINKIEFRFCDQYLGKKYNVDTLASFLFDIAESDGSTKVDKTDTLSIISIPQDVMFRMRKTLLSVMNFECTDPVERQYLQKWCDSFIFMDPRGKAIRHSNHVREAVAEAVHAKESILHIMIDSSACVKIPKDTAVATVANISLVTTLRASTSITRSPRTVLTAPSDCGRPPLAPKHNVVSPAKKNLNYNIMKKSPIKISDALKSILPLPLTEKDVLGSSCNLSLSSNTSTMDIDDCNKDCEKKKPEHDSNENHVCTLVQEKSFNLEDLIDDCVLVAEPEDISPFLVSSDDDGLLSSVMQMTGFASIMDNDFVYPSPIKGPYDVHNEGNGSTDTHCYLLPSFFDESTSLMSTSGSCGCMDDSCLFDEHERDMAAILQSIMDIVEDTTMEVTVCEELG